MKQDINDRQGQLFASQANVQTLGDTPLPQKAKEHQQRLVKLIEQQSHRFHHREVFVDFVTMEAIALARVDLPQARRRETIYMERIARYNKTEQARFGEMMVELVEAIHACPWDVLGEVFMALGLGNARTGQYFSPNAICDLMAKLTFDSVTQADIDQDGFVCMQEPACGSGAMIIAGLESLRMRGINYQQHVHVSATDLDPTAAKMAFVQLSLLYVPAMIINGNSITLETYEVWYTPAHVLEGWSMRLRHRGERKPGCEPAPAGQSA